MTDCKLFLRLHEIVELLRDVLGLVSVPHNRFHGFHDSVDALRIVTENINTCLSMETLYIYINIISFNNLINGKTLTLAVFFFVSVLFTNVDLN